MSFSQLQLEEIPLAAHRVQYVITDFKQFVKAYTPLIKRISKNLAKQWEADEQKSKKEIKRDSGKQKLARWKERAKIYRKKALHEFSQTTFQELWRIRSDLELVIATLRLSFYEDYIFMDTVWEKKKAAELESIVLRLKGPTTPKKKPFTITDIKYNIGDAVLDMFVPFTKGIDKAKKKLYKIKLPDEILEFEKEYVKLQNAVSMGDVSKTTDIQTVKLQMRQYLKNMTKTPEGQKFINKLFQNLFLAREYISLLVQAANPRTTFKVENSANAR